MTQACSFIKKVQVPKHRRKSVSILTAIVYNQLRRMVLRQPPRADRPPFCYGGGGQTSCLSVCLGAKVRTAMAYKQLLQAKKFRWEIGSTVFGPGIGLRVRLKTELTFEKSLRTIVKYNWIGSFHLTIMGTLLCSSMNMYTSVLEKHTVTLYVWLTLHNSCIECNNNYSSLHLTLWMSGHNFLG
jgi:hypothetical protein